MDNINNLYNTRIATFVKRPAKGLNEGHLEFLKENLPKYEARTNSHILDCKKVILEIGFGSGEHLYNEATNNPDFGYIGAEPYVKGMVNMLKKLDNGPLDNVNLIYDDARNFLDKMDKSFLDKIYILFPDPWPKKKHHKRRIISEENLTYFKSKLKEKGEILVGTDHEGYKLWIKDHLQILSEKMNFSYDIFFESPLSIKTKYQGKAEQEGRAAEFYLIKF